MVELQTVINELKTGKIEFKRDENSSFCTTEGELVFLLEELYRLREEVNLWHQYPDEYPEEENFYWITYKMIDIDGKEVLTTAKAFYSETYHAFMDYNNKVIAWKAEKPYVPNPN